MSQLLIKVQLKQDQRMDSWSISELNSNINLTRKIFLIFIIGMGKITKHPVLDLQLILLMIRLQIMRLAVFSRI